MNDNINWLKFFSIKKMIWLSLAISVGLNLIFLLFFFFGRTFFMPPDKVGGPPPFELWRILIQTLTCFILVFALFIYNRYAIVVTSKRRRALLHVVLGSLLLTLTLSLFFSSIPLLCHHHELHPNFVFRVFRDGVMRDLSTMVIVILLVQLLYSLFRQKTIAVENEVLRTENIRTRYEVLKSQMDPHFLFNSLNTLKSLISIDKDKADDYLQQLSYVLRCTLQNKDIVSLAEELKCVKAYCSLMKIRYGDGLCFSFDVGEDYLSCAVLALSIQGLVENAVKHNVISDKRPLSISVFVRDDAIVVSNPIQAKYAPEHGNRIGLVNLKERYRLMWNTEVTIDNTGEVFTVSIPLIRNNESINN